MDDDDAIIGIGLGCNGIITILIEPIDQTNPYHSIFIMDAISQLREPSVIATVFSLKNKKYQDAGTKWYWTLASNWKGNTDDAHLLHDICIFAEQVLTDGQNNWLDINESGEDLTIFFEYCPPSIRLVIAGAGNDILPVLDIAQVLGWETSVVDGRANYAKKERFSNVCQVVLSKPGQVLDHVLLDDYTCFLLMTHNYNYDKALLYELCSNKVRYIAMLGPKQKLERMITEYEEEGRPLTKDQIAYIFSPAGLDIGAETAEEIALSITSEIKSFYSKRQSQPLRDKPSGIHT